MALFNTYLPNQSTQPRFRSFSSDWWGRTKLGLTGQNSQGGSNLWGSALDKGLSPVLSILGGWVGGPLGAAAGNAIGGLANTGLNSLSERITAGTDTNKQSVATNDREERNDALINVLSQAAGSASSAAKTSGIFSGTKTPVDSGFTTSAQGKAFDSMMRGQNNKLSGFAGSTAQASTPSGFGAVANSIPKTSFLDVLKQNNQGQNNQNSTLLNAVNLLNQLNQGQQNTQNIMNLANAGQFQMNATQQGQMSSILQSPTDNSNITWLEEEKKNKQVGQTTLPNSLYGGYSGPNGFAEGGKSETGKIYDSEDKTSEDYFMVPIETAKHFGMSSMIDAMSIGAGRYEERIFDQESNIKQEAIMKANLPVEKKQTLLGQHIYEELLTHKDLMPEKQNFATGGKIKYKTDAKASSGIKDFQQAYNEWSRNQGLPAIAVDGKYGPQTSAAVTNWNASNFGREIYVDAVSQGTKNGVRTKAIKDLTLESAFSPRSYVGRDFKSAIRGYDDKGNPVTEKGAQDYTGGNLRLGGTNALAGDALARTNAGTSAMVNGTAQPTSQSTTPFAGTSAPVAGLTPFQRQNAFGNLADLAVSGIGAITAANNPIPRYKPTSEYNNMLSQVYAQKDQGFTPNEQAAVNQGLQNNYAQSVNTIRQVAGGGASQGAVLGALSSASSQLNNATLNAAVQGDTLRRNNFQNYQRTVNADETLNQNLFAQDQQAALAQRSAGVQMLDAGLQNIAERQQFNSQYGPGTTYDQLQQAQLAGAQKQNQLAELYPQIYANALRESLKKNAVNTLKI